MSKKVNQAVILAGGKGTRLRPFTETMPKPMYPIDGVPFIERLVLQIKSFGINRILILVGYLGDKIVEYLGDGSKYGVNIEYDYAPVEFNTGGRLLHAKEKIDKYFLLMYCDNYSPFNFQKNELKFFESGADIQVTVYENGDNYTKNNMQILDNGIVNIYDKSRKEKNLKGVDIGYLFANKKVIDYVTNTDDGFFEKVFPELIKRKKLTAVITKHRYYSIGSFDRMDLTKEFFKNKKVAFLDRDGTLNVKAPKASYIEKPEDFVWLEGAIEAIKLLKENGYITILITNQPGIARGMLDEKTLASIHKKMNDDLKNEGSKIDYIYYCPHGWDDGCECRKPKPGLFYKAQKDLSLDLTKCVMFGDDERDYEAASKAEVECIMVNEDYSLLDAVNDYIKKEKKE